MVRREPYGADRRWPNLYRFLAGYLHRDWPEESGSVEAALERAVVDHDPAERRQVLREWLDWHATEGAQDHVLVAINEGLGVDVHFERSSDGHRFMADVHARLVASITRETDLLA